MAEMIELKEQEERVILVAVSTGEDDDTAASVDELEELIVHKAGLWLDSGRIFGKSGEGFQRINAACPRSTLQEALERIEKALEKVE